MGSLAEELQRLVSSGAIAPVPQQTPKQVMNEQIKLAGLEVPAEPKEIPAIKCNPTVIRWDNMGEWTLSTYAAALDELCGDLPDKVQRIKSHLGKYQLTKEEAEKVPAPMLKDFRRVTAELESKLIQTRRLVSASKSA